MEFNSGGVPFIHIIVLIVSSCLPKAGDPLKNHKAFRSLVFGEKGQGSLCAAFKGQPLPGPPVGQHTKSVL